MADFKIIKLNETHNEKFKLKSITYLIKFTNGIKSASALTYAISSLLRKIKGPKYSESKIGTKILFNEDERPMHIQYIQNLTTEFILNRISSYLQSNDSFQFRQIKITFTLFKTN